MEDFLEISTSSRIWRRAINSSLVMEQQLSWRRHGDACFPVVIKQLLRGSASSVASTCHRHDVKGWPPQQGKAAVLPCGASQAVETPMSTNRRRKAAAEVSVATAPASAQCICRQYDESKGRAATTTNAGQRRSSILTARVVVGDAPPARRYRKCTHTHLLPADTTTPSGPINVVIQSKKTCRRDHAHIES